MSKNDKLIERFKNAKTGFTWNELVKLLSALGYEKREGSGSRVKFDNGNPSELINLHKPHPGNELKSYALKQVQEKLKTWGKI